MTAALCKKYIFTNHICTMLSQVSQPASAVYTMKKSTFSFACRLLLFFVFSLFLMCGLFDTLCLDLQQQMVRCLWNGGAQCQLELKVVFPQWVAKRHTLSNCWCYFSDCCLSFYSFSFLHRITARQRK